MTGAAIGAPALGDPVLCGAMLDDGARPALLRGVRTKFDTVRNIWVLLAPERTLKLDLTGAAVIDAELTYRVTPR